MSGDVKPKLWFLLTQIGVDAEDVGSYLTRNPHFLLQKTSDLWERVNYLKGKKFNSEQIKKIAIGYRYFLNTDVKIIDYRLGWLQKQFHLTGKEVRTLLTKEPRILAFGTGPIQVSIF
jgi:mTERF domain-containing protein